MKVQIPIFSFYENFFPKDKMTGSIRKLRRPIPVRYLRKNDQESQILETRF